MSKISPEEKKKTLIEIFRRDFEAYKEFVFESYLTLEPADFHRELINDYKKHRFIVRACPRGSAKTTHTDLLYLSWLIVTDQTKFAVIISDTYGQAVMFLENLKQELESNELIKWLYGDLKSDKWSEGDFITSTGVRIMAKGAGQKVRGLLHNNTRPDLAILDDIENEELTANKERRDKLERWFNGSVIPSLSRSGRVIFIGTIIHFDSLLSRVLDPNKYLDFDKKIYRIIKDNGEPLWEQYMNLEQINALKKDFSGRGLIDVFMAEYMNNPIDPENAAFKRKWFKYYTAEDVISKKFKKYLTIDPAISEREGSDNRAMVVVGIDEENKWYILDKIVGIFDPFILIENIFKLHEKWNLDKIGIETVFFQKVLMYMIKKEMRERNVFLPLFELKANRSKDSEERIKGLISVYRSGTLYHRGDGKEADLEEELLTFPVGKHDDMIDALAYVLQIAQLQPVKRPKTNQTPQEKAGEYFKKIQERKKRDLQTFNKNKLGRF